MNAAAAAVVRCIPEICIGYGVSDEYSFVFHRSTELFERRARYALSVLSNNGAIGTNRTECYNSKLVTTVVSTFTAYYIHLWSTYRPAQPLSAPWLPTFDGRAVCYPSTANLRDYMTWRQVDCKLLHCPLIECWAEALTCQVTSTISTTPHSGA